jgi:hypothetical protein
MNCPDCSTRLLKLYYRKNNTDGTRSWQKTRIHYCRICKKPHKNKKEE